MDVIKGPAERVLHKEIVERHAVTRRVDTRVDDAAARQMDAACNTVEETWMVGGIDRHQRRPARRIDRCCDGKISSPRLVDMARVALQNVIRLCHPIRFGQPLGVSGEIGGRPSQRLLQQFLLKVDTVSPATLFVAQT